MDIYLNIGDGLDLAYKVYRTDEGWRVSGRQLIVEEDSAGVEVLDQIPMALLLYKLLDLEMWLSSDDLSRELVAAIERRINVNSRTLILDIPGLLALLPYSAGSIFAVSQAELLEALESDDAARKSWAKKERAKFQSIREANKSYVMQKYGGKCQYCGSEENLSIDHDIPISKGGTNSRDNFVLACRSCNSKKGNRPYMQLIGGSNGR